MLHVGYTVEWGLPYVCILLWLQGKVKPAEIGKIITAEIPDPKVDSTLYEIIASTMVYGPCGNYNRSLFCMANGVCGKRYPPPLITENGDNGYLEF